MGRQFKPGQLQTGSLYNISSSFALTASFALNGGGSFPFSGSAVITGSLYVSGSGITGSLLGTASYATNALSASYAQTASYVQNAQTASYVLSASYALTASYVNPLYQQILLSGSLKFDPTQDPDPLGIDLDSTVLFQSSSNTALGYDLYVRQNGNLIKWKWIEGILETGLLYGGVVTYSGSNVFVSPGSGIIADHNATTGSEVSPMIEYVTWNAITQSITNIATQQVTYLYIDNNGALQQQSTRFTSQQYHDYIPLGAVGHFDYIQVSAFGGGVQTAYDQISQISNFIDAFGPLKMSGYGLTGQPGSLRLSVGSGISFIHGGFYQNDPEFPSQITTPSQATASMARVQRSGSVIEFDTNNGNLYTVVDPTQYDRDGDGILHSVGSGNWSIQRVFTDPKTGVLYVYYGQARYTNLLNALQYLPTDPFTEGDTFDFTTFVGFLVLKGNASNIADTANNSIINGGLFRGSGQGSGGGIALSNLDDLTDVSITAPTDGQALVYNTGIWINSYPTSASFATTASYVTLAQTASYVQTAQTASYVLNAVSASYAPDTTFPYTGSAGITGSLTVVGKTQSTQIGAGTSPSGSVPLDVRAQGALSTDLAFRIRNSADTNTILSLNGLGAIEVRSNAVSIAQSRRLLIGGTNTDNAVDSTAYDEITMVGYNNINANYRATLLGSSNTCNVQGGSPAVLVGYGNTSTSGGNIILGKSNTGQAPLIVGASNAANGGGAGSGVICLGNSNTISAANGYPTLPMVMLGSSVTIPNDISVNNCVFLSAGADGTNPYVTFKKNNISIGSLTPWTANFDNNSTGTFYTKVGVAPTTMAAGTIAMYAASSSASNAKPYFRTENGTVVWLGDESRLFNVTASRTIISSSQNTISGSSLTVYGSGSAQPVFTVQGSQGELFSITDSLSGSLFSVNDISGLPIMEVFSDNTTLMGSYLAPSLNTTAKVVQTNSGSFTMYSLPTASYDTAFFEYSVRSGSNARAGTIMAIQSGSAVNFTETTTTDFGSTSAVSFAVVVTGSNMALTGSSTSGAWTIKTIVRSI